MQYRSKPSIITGQGKKKRTYIIICLITLFLALPLTMTAAQTKEGFPTHLSGAEIENYSIGAADVDDPIYLPLLLKNFPPIPEPPTLNAISNTGGVGSYNVSWSASGGATGYTLEEDDHSGFTSPNTVYSGPNTSTSINGKDLGTYYYRVQASNDYGSSAWSNVESVLVTQEVEVCPETAAWRGYTDEDWTFDFEIDTTPQCQIKDYPELQIRFEDPCSAGNYIMAVFDYDIPIVNNHFDTGSWNNARMIGDFTSPTTVSGTYSYDGGGTCTTSGTWTAEYNTGANSTVSALAVQPDGKILVGGRFT
ncbi:MAG: fibronectin type III domain-containing protein, partial [Gammaproteobacteria bacterium]|nr:fibronectin type III domain-containing protein [candidate division Zixibacteria bacterium]NIR92741.1 fibronectin type III domain-containing protein [Gammaproteobacteria bacterium]NIT55179.1 fibronectin type III domain-containing protein [Fodinibius sp.]NIR62549.1 fibronectin type III domain-containing protein [candidate division Zixibacteria bacterium]NIS44682.1 fibronectin type III domain-containing protein [candidate division Zixibacteria bacterium]